MVAFNEQILKSQRPNFFELLAQEAMREALRPAFEYVCKVVTHSEIPQHASKETWCELAVKNMDVDGAIHTACLRLGYSSLRKEQEEAMKNFASGRDVFLSVPSGGGKSLCYAILPWVFDQMRQRAGRSIVIVVLVHSNPEILQHLWRFCDELYLIFESLLQLHFVINHGGSFSEHFYCLIRRGPQRNGPLGAREKQLSLLCLTVVPYLVVKMDRLYSRLQEEDDAVRITWNSGKGPKALGKLLYFVIYPYFHSVWNGVKFIFRLRYLFEQTEYYSPLLWFAGVTLSRDLANEQSSPLSVDSLWRRVVNSALPVSVFALKLIEWWYSTERSAAVRMMTSLPIPPPPPLTQPSEDGIRLPQNPQLCPLCVKRRVDPTAIATSGYVFCYSCIMGYLRMHKECPVTCIPTSEQQLIRLYQQQNA